MSPGANYNQKVLFGLSPLAIAVEQGAGVGQTKAVFLFTMVSLLAPYRVTRHELSFSLPVWQAGIQALTISRKCSCALRLSSEKTIHLCEIYNLYTGFTPFLNF